MGEIQETERILMITLRKARKKDKEALHRVHVSSIRNLCRNHYQRREIQVWSGMLKPKSYEEIIKHRYVYVAEKNHKIIGFGQFNPKIGEIEALYMSPVHTGKGIGGRLLQKMEKSAFQREIKTVQLFSTLNAVGFYKKAGYQRIQRASYHLVDDIHLSCILMKKNITQECEGKRGIPNDSRKKFLFIQKGVLSN